MNKVIISISEETKAIIETFTGMTVEAFMEKTKDDILKNYSQCGSITIRQAAELMGKSQQFIRVGLQRGLFPFGVAVKVSGDKYTYYISPKKFYEYVGGEYSR